MLRRASDPWGRATMIATHSSYSIASIFHLFKNSITFFRIYIYPNKLAFCFAALLPCGLIGKHLARSADLDQDADVTSNDDGCRHEDTTYRDHNDVYLSSYRDIDKNIYINLITRPSGVLVTSSNPIV